MNITNKHGLPEAIVRAVQNDSYSKGDADFSATELLQPPRVRALKKRHEHEIEEDASDRIWALLGQAVHVICERGNTTDVAEKRFFAKFDGYTVSAQIDSLGLKSGLLTDYKVSTVYKFKPDAEPDPDFVAQLNIQLEILRKNGLDATGLQIVGILRDWSKNKARTERNYPERNVVTQEIPIWSREKTQSFIRMRIALHKAAEIELPECSTDERWAKPDIYAVMKGKRAISGGLQFSQEAAEKLCQENPGTRVELRRGESTRCAFYCAVSEFCLQYRKEKQSKLKEEISDAV